jgi:hypothetical protein
MAVTALPQARHADTDYRVFFDDSLSTASSTQSACAASTGCTSIG